MTTSTTAKATFGAGCFWGVEATFRQLDGVNEALSGYSGGALDNPSYQDVCSGTTGHAEVVEVIYDPAIITYQELLDVFFANHNPCQLNRQGPDVGTQYRSAVFYHDSEQQQLAQTTIAKLQQSEAFAGRKIVTEVTAATTFFKAEEYHQNYLAKRGLSSCHI